MAALHKTAVGTQKMLGRKILRPNKTNLLICEAAARWPRWVLNGMVLFPEICCIFANSKQNHVIKKIGDNIVSPLGFTTEENWRNLLAGHSGQQPYEQGFSLPEPFCASVINNALLEKQFLALPNPHNIRYTKMEKCALLSATDAIARAGIDAASSEVLFILSTTKGNVELLRDLQGYEPERPYLWRSAQLIAQYFGNPNEPIVVSNACISGCAAQVVAQRQLEQGRYRYAVVIGADVLSQFIISGFQSFKALSPEPCRPFDAERTGLNLGEAAATLVFARADQSEPTNLWLLNGALCNDANHISAPSRTAEGLVKAIQQILPDTATPDLAFVNAHGTATRYNDDMESVALQRCGLDQLPVNSLKGYFGHTLGAAGVVESIISCQEINNGTILPTRGFTTPGTVAPIQVATMQEKTDKPLFIKMISGFGGSNAALLFAKNNAAILKNFKTE